MAEAYQGLGEFVLPKNADRGGELIAKADTIASAVVAKNPADRQAKLRLASLALTRGGMFDRVGFAAPAEVAYRKAYQLQVEFLVAEPHNAGVQFAAVQSCRWLSDLFTRKENKGLGRDFAVTAFWRMTAVLAADPGNPVYLRAMRDIHRQNADITLLWKGWVGARNHQRQALVYTRKLALADPTNIDLLRDQLALLRELAESSLQLGHKSAARDHLTQALAVARRLKDADAVTALDARMKGAVGPDQKFTANSIGLDLVLVPAGTFTMGGDESAETVQKEFKEAIAPFHAEHPAHEVRITKSFHLGATEVTRGQFRAFIDATGYRTEAEKDGAGVTQFTTSTGGHLRQMENWRADGFVGLSDDHPVVGVTWNDAAAFCAWLSQKEGRTYRLPSEAEWEYACRAGTKTRYWTGDDPESLVNGANVPDQSFRDYRGNQGYAVLTGRDGYGEVAPVGEFAANPFGLYDVHGNVWEMCRDGWDAKFYEKKVKDDPLTPDGPLRAMRGGCFM